MLFFLKTHMHTPTFTVTQRLNKSLSLSSIPASTNWLHADWSSPLLPPSQPTSTYSTHIIHYFIISNFVSFTTGPVAQMHTLTFTYSKATAGGCSHHMLKIDGVRGANTPHSRSCSYVNKLSLFPQYFSLFQHQSA